MATDPRLLTNGQEIPTESYSDQPYVVQTDDGAWLCCVTTGPGHEGVRGQHVTTLRSTDQGQTWSDPVPVEPPDSPENSYAVMLKAPSGRIFIFYNHNTDNVREVKWHNGQGTFSRVDSLGYYVYKVSDDHGRSWSTERWPIPVREFECDRENVYGGAVRFFWNVGKPWMRDGIAYVPLIKVGGFGEGFFVKSEGVLLRSDNLATEDNPGELHWETLPDGDIGLRTPAGGGPISEEQSYCLLSDGSICVVYRSTDGWPVESYSRDHGHTWSPPRYRRFADGRLMKHPRAANFNWRCSNGKFLYWFHNHGGRDYEDRNPVWLCGGEEAPTPDGPELRWSQPEIVLYDDDPYLRMSYPDLIEEDGRLYLTETQKDKARVHELEPSLLEGLWNQFTATGVTRDGLLAELPAEGSPMPLSLPAPTLTPLLKRDHTRLDFGTRDLRHGWTLDLTGLLAAAAGTALIEGRLPTGQGLALLTAGNGAVELVLNDGRTECRWASDPLLLQPGKSHSVTVIIDGGPKLILFVVDGQLNDGGSHRQFGWGRFSPHLRHANGAGQWTLDAAVKSLRVYNRALRVSEAIANQRTT